MFFADTCFWLHAQALHEASIYDFRDLLEEFEIGITPFLRVEFRYHLADFLDVDRFYSKPVTRPQLTEVHKINPILAEFDVADQSLFFVGWKYKDAIITDDRALLAECVYYKLTAFHMADLVLLLVEQGDLRKSDAYNIFKFLLQQRVIPRKGYNAWRKRLNLIR